FPVLCYVVAVGLALRFVLHDGKVDRTEVSTVFTILGTMSFAALLPFGLLLYKTGPFWMSIMYLAPVVTLWGLPLLATGTVLWRRIQDKDLVASRMAGTALGLLGLMYALTGMIPGGPKSRQHNSRGNHQLRHPNQSGNRAGDSRCTLLCRRL